MGQTLHVNANQAFNMKPVATLVAQDPNATMGDFTARIDWGDGFWSNGVVADTGTSGAFAVLGSHTYVGHQSTIYPITVYITDKLGSETVAPGEADVTFVPSPQSSGTAPAPNPPGTPAGPQPPNSITPQGWYVSPAGTQTELGDKPFGIALSPDGKYLAVTNDGAGTQSIMVVDRANDKVDLGDRLHRSRGRVRRHRLQPGRLEALRLGRRHVLRPGRHARPEGLV